MAEDGGCGWAKEGTQGFALQYRVTDISQTSFRWSPKTLRLSSFDLQLLLRLHGHCRLLRSRPSCRSSGLRRELHLLGAESIAGRGPKQRHALLPLLYKDRELLGNGFRRCV